MLLSELRLYLCFTPMRCRHDPWDTLIAALDAGVDIVQWRVEDEDPDGLDRCLGLCRAAGVPLVINNDVMLAVRSKAAGAHVGQDDMPAHAARKLTGRGILGVSTHDRRQIADAIAAGADYVGFGPCFPTPTKGYEHGQEPAAIADAITAAGTTPLFAIGGIHPGNLPMLCGLGIDRIAVSGAILDSEEPSAATAALRRLLGARG